MIENAKEEGGLLDFNNLFDSLRRNPVSSRCTGISSDYNSALESERKSCSTMGQLDRTIGISIVVCHSPKECGWLLKLC
jgi:hypothetical protein